MDQSTGALSLFQPDASPAAILRDELYAGRLKRLADRNDGIRPASELSISSLEPLYSRLGYRRGSGKIRLRPREQSARGFNLTN